MSILYQLLVTISQGLLPIAGLFFAKIRLFQTGRKEVFKKLKQGLDPAKKTLWLHAASLGEYEQGVPVLEALRASYPQHQILLTFFSPSGYTLRNKSPLAHCVTYLPLDSLKNAMKFIAIVKPVAAFFVKYEVWPNYLLALDQAQVPSILFSGIFRPNQIYFKWYGGFMKTSLKRFSKIYVQDVASLELLLKEGITTVALSGDTRFDRVHALSKNPKPLPTKAAAIITAFINVKPCLVGGSVWPEDLEVLATAFEKNKERIKFILAPHKIDVKHLAVLLNKMPTTLQEKTVILSKTNALEASKASILIIDAIGILNRIYPLAQIAYVGGGFKTGLHNTLEAAVFGIPLAIGPEYHKFKEATDLVALGGISVIHKPADADIFLAKATENSYRSTVKEIQQSYIHAHLGGTKKIMKAMNDFDI